MMRRRYLSTWLQRRVGALERRRTPLLSRSVNSMSMSTLKPVHTLHTYKALAWLRHSSARRKNWAFATGAG
eukprot:scaffold8462_cov64-Phaeocystis_antarctica.AAC.1